jgi:NADH-quinone oxidoreductase subunit I
MADMNNKLQYNTGISPMPTELVKTKKVRRSLELTLWEKLYIFEVVRGLFITTRHLVVNLIGFVLPPSGKKRSIPTVYYPEEKRVMPEAYRGRPVLVMQENGSEKCVACGLCEKICPGRAITIVAREKENGDRFPLQFTIDMTRCVYCGYCEEVCPKEAIVMSKEYENMAAYNRGEMIYTKESLLRPEKDVRERLEYVRRIYSKCNY